MSVSDSRNPSLSGVINTCAVALNWAKPMKNNAKPMMISLKSLRFRCFFDCIRMKPMRING